MRLKGMLMLHIFQAELADIKYSMFGKLNRERRVIPGFDLIFAYHNFVKILYFRVKLLVLTFQALRGKIIKLD